MGKDQSRDVFGVDVPGSGEAVFLQYDFKAKLGIDGGQVTVQKTGTTAYRISVPEFIFIGYDEPTFKVAVEDGGLLSWVTPDIDELAMVNEILDDDAQQTYIDDHDDLLQEQTKVFYESLIKSIDPTIVTTFEFRS